MMVRPVKFGYNEQTAESNSFMHEESDLKNKEIEDHAVSEFDAFVRILKDAGIQVSVFQDLPQPHTPDSVFPNNWISVHRDGKIIVYPMMAPNRRAEVRDDIIQAMAGLFSHPQIIDLRHFAEEGLFLESTGSMVIDRLDQKVYACISPRTSPALLERFCQEFDCQLVEFHAVDEDGQDIYHTNVLMGLGLGFSLICLDAIRNGDERQMVIENLEKSGFEVIPITYYQMNNFAGNMLQAISQDGTPYVVLSQRAHSSLTENQLAAIKKHTDILTIPLDVIETSGGGSVRCMLAEVFTEI